MIQRIIARRLMLPKAIAYHWVMSMFRWLILYMFVSLRKISINTKYLTGQTERQMQQDTSSDL